MSGLHATRKNRGRNTESSNMSRLGPQMQHATLTATTDCGAGETGAASQLRGARAFDTEHTLSSFHRLDRTPFSQVGLDSALDCHKIKCVKLLTRVGLVIMQHALLVHGT